MKLEAILVLLAAMTGTARAQSPQFQVALQLAAEGRSDSARHLVAAELARSRPGDSLFVEALYWRGRLASSADSAERDLRRVAIEYSTSKWADDALLQLAQLSLASGNGAASLGYAQRLRSDYPGSALRASAALWGGRAAFDATQPAVACALLDSARAEAPGDVEFQNQVAFFRSRCTSLVLAPLPPAPLPPPAAPRTDSALAPQPNVPPRADTAAETALPPVAPRGDWDVQVAAPRSEAAARDIADRFTRAGMPARVIPGPGGVFRVRLGPYATLRAAQDAAVGARRFVTERPFVVRR